MGEYLFQFPAFTAQDAAYRMFFGEPGPYQPWSLNGPGGIKDSIHEKKGSERFFRHFEVESRR